MATDVEDGTARGGGGGFNQVYIFNLRLNLIFLYVNFTYLFFFVKL